MADYYSVQQRANKPLERAGVGPSGYGDRRSPAAQRRFVRLTMMSLPALLTSVFLVALTATAIMADDRTIGVAPDDREMNAAISEARRTIKQFFDAFANRRKGQTSFLLKVAFVSGDQVEHIWLADLDFSGAKPKGVIANEPQIPGFRFEQTVEFYLARVTDWMYVDNGTLVGGYTTRLLRSRMSPEDRKKLDAQAPYNF
jgi:uncharacterized protein YegJ (DUF2314 family)